ncbi:MAG: hypothetical protein C0478_12575 [Planctomyces sp.]|jgi:CBS domain-containing protein|nr:hypothetical protein [Planctomyces sp.]
MRLTVGDLMTTAITISPQATLQSALALLVNSGVQELYVVGPKKKLLGILPDYELLKAQLAETDPQATVERWMVASVQTLTPTTDLAVATNLFRAGNCSRAAVLQKGQLVGVVSRLDILRLCLILRVDGPHTADAAVDEVETSVAGPASSRTQAAKSNPTKHGAAKNAPAKTTTSPKAPAKSSPRTTTVPEPKFMTRQTRAKSGRKTTGSKR